MKILIYFALYLAVSATTRSGNCPKPTTSFQFDIKSYLGLWYEIVRSVNLVSNNGACNYQDIKAKGDSGAFEVHSWSRIDGGFQENIWNGFCDTRQKFLGRCYLQLGGSDWENFKVVSTDYINYAVIHGCKNIGSEKFDFLWVLARQKHFDWTQLRPTVEDLGFEESDLVTNIQLRGDCPDNN